MKIVWVSFVFWVVFGWAHAEIPLCTPERPHWDQLQKELESTLQKHQPIALPWDTACLVPKGSAAPSQFGNILFRYMWSVMIWQQAADFFERPLSEMYQSQARVLRSLCFEKFPTHCGRFLKYREQFLDQR